MATYLYKNDEQATKVIQIDKAAPEYIFQAGQLEPVEAIAMFDIYVEGYFDVGMDGAAYSLRSDLTEGQVSISIHNVIPGEQASLIKASEIH